MDKKKLKDDLDDKIIQLQEVAELDFIEVGRAHGNLKQSLFNMHHIIETLSEGVIDTHSLFDAFFAKHADALIPSPAKEDLKSIYSVLTSQVNYIKKFSDPLI